MYGSSDRYSVRSSTCPGPGCGSGRRSRRKSAATGAPCGRRARTMRRFSTACAFIAVSSSAHVLDLHAGRRGHGAVDEQVTEQDGVRVDAVGLEVAHAGLVEHRVIDEELPATRAGGATEDAVGGIRYYFRLARAAQHVRAAEGELDGRRGDGGTRPQRVAGDARLAVLGGQTQRAQRHAVLRQAV